MTVVIVGVKNVFLRAQRVTVGSRVYLGWTRVDEPIKKVLVRKLSFLDQLALQPNYPSGKRKKVMLVASRGCGRGVNTGPKQ